MEGHSAATRSPVGVPRGAFSVEPLCVRGNRERLERGRLQRDHGRSIPASAADRDSDSDFNTLTVAVPISHRFAGADTECDRDDHAGRRATNAVAVTNAEPVADADSEPDKHVDAVTDAELPTIIPTPSPSPSPVATATTPMGMFF